MDGLFAPIRRLVLAVQKTRPITRAALALALSFQAEPLASSMGQRLRGRRNIPCGVTRRACSPPRRHTSSSANRSAEWAPDFLAILVIHVLREVGGHQTGLQLLGVYLQAFGPGVLEKAGW